MSTQLERVVMELRGLIYQGAFAAGEKLAEIPLAERLDASRTPVRLALGQLAQEGLVQANAKGGFFVRSFTENEINDAIDVRGLLEGMTARLVAEHGVTRALSRDLAKCLDTGDELMTKPELAIQDYEVFARMNTEFHELIIESAGNAALFLALETVNRLPFASASAFAKAQSVMPDGREVLFIAHSQHQSLVAAMEAGQGTRAEAIAAEHAQIAKRNLQALINAPKISGDILPALRLVHTFGRGE
jgi:GntR family transcriptional regulator, vanillate catabolism transcriptional regulator